MELLRDLQDLINRSQAEAPPTELQWLQQQLEMASDAATTREVGGYEFNRKLLFKILVMANSQLAEIVQERRRAAIFIPGASEPLLPCAGARSQLAHQRGVCGHDRRHLARDRLDARRAMPSSRGDLCRQPDFGAPSAMGELVSPLPQRHSCVISAAAGCPHRLASGSLLSAPLPFSQTSRLLPFRSTDGATASFLVPAPSVSCSRRTRSRQNTCTDRSPRRAGHWPRCAFLMAGHCAC